MACEPGMICVSALSYYSLTLGICVFMHAGTTSGSNWARVYIFTEFHIFKVLIRNPHEYGKLQSVVEVI